MRPIDIAPADLETVRCILREYAPELEVRAFGSRVSWTARETSDLDLALLTEEPLSIARMTNLRAAFTKSYLPFRVDIVDWASASESFQKVIEREHVVLVEKQGTTDSDQEITVYGILSADRRKNSLTDLCHHENGIQTGPFGSQLHQRDYVPVGTPIITVEHLGENRITHKNLPRVSDNDKERLSKYTLRKGDIVFSRVGSVDRRALVREAEEGWLFSGRCLRVRPDPNKVDPKFLSYFFGWRRFQEHIRSIAVGATMPSLNTQLLSDVFIHYPSLSTQCTIAHILGTLDDKIELNRRMNKTLEEMAQALFKSWFVDFEPVKAKLAVLDKGGTADEAERAAMCAISGKDEFALSKLEKEQPEAFSNLAQTASQFPFAMQNSELGEIPKGWEIVPFQSAVNFKEGPGIRNWQYTNSDQGTHFINIRCIQNGDLDLKTANRITDQEANGRYSHFHLQEWDIVVSTSGTLGRNAIIRKEHLPLVLNTSVIRFRPKQNRIMFGYLYGYLNSNEFMTNLESMASGSVQKNFGPMHLNQLSILCPTSNCIEHYEKTTLPLFRLLIENRRVNETLANVRNVLLPKLISGQIRVANSTLKKWLDRKR